MNYSNYLKPCTLDTTWYLDSHPFCLYIEVYNYKKTKIDATVLKCFHIP